MAQGGAGFPAETLQSCFCNRHANDLSVSIQRVDAAVRMGVM